MPITTETHGFSLNKCSRVSFYIITLILFSVIISFIMIMVMLIIMDT